MNVLLIEADYKNKYPPIGLMKISTYHKNRGDDVTFYKGLMSEQQLMHEAFERVYVTSLFTFYYDRTISTLNYYRKFFSDDEIYFGGIMVSILTSKVCMDTKLPHILTGLLTSSNMIGFQDNINIDELPLDYALLDEIEYEYPSSGNYFSYATRGCPNRCDFCAVPILEPEYRIIHGAAAQITDAMMLYAERRNLLLLDNNVFNLDCKQLQELVDSLIDMGFSQTPTFVKLTPLEIFLDKYNNPKLNSRVTSSAITYLYNLIPKIKSNEERNNYQLFLSGLEDEESQAICIYRNDEYLLNIAAKYTHRRSIQRYVDFNQGLEGARITKEKMLILSKLPLRPVRIAFDHYNDKAVDIYKKAVAISVDCGIKEFSNYMLYNYDDKPSDLWYRLKTNIALAQEYELHMFSFPMKYAPINQTNRAYVGEHWNRHFLRSIQAILLVTKGIVASGESFFERAFGQSIESFYEILYMPKDFIIYRQYYENSQLTQQWHNCYMQLNEEDKNELIKALDTRPFSSNYTKIADILAFYQPRYTYCHIAKNGGTV